MGCEHPARHPTLNRMANRRLHRLLAAVAAVAATAVYAQPGVADAATQLGQLRVAESPSGCIGGINMVQSATAAGASYEVPSGGGVITSWQHNADSTTPGSGRLQVWEPVGGTSFSLVGRSDLRAFTAGVTSTFPTRIPVSGGALLGLRVASGSGACAFASGAGDEARFQGGNASDPAPGEVRDLLNLITPRRVNVAASLEADADGDGFGDETQDGCPTNASAQGACPPSTAPPSTAPSNEFEIGKLKGKKLALTVPGPGEVEVTDVADQGTTQAVAAAKKKRLKPSSATATAAGRVTVKLKLVKKAKKKLKQKGKVKVNAEITFTPTGGSANTETAKLKVKK